MSHAKPEPTARPRLTRLQEETLRHTMAGRTFVETAALMGISPSAVQYHSNRCKVKLGVEHRRHLAVAGWEYFNGKGEA